MKRILTVVFPFVLLISSCNWFKTTPEVGIILADHFKNKIYKNFDTAAYNQVFRKTLDSLKPKLSNPNTLGKFYESEDMNTTLVTRFFVDGQLDTLAAYVGNSKLHGYKPSLFGYTRLTDLLEELRGNQFKNIEEAYPVIAELELFSASALLKYDTFVGFGSINPRKVLNRYYVTTTRPDSVYLSGLLKVENLEKHLQQIQPRSANYLALQRSLGDLEKSSNPNSELIKTTLVNMERLRWKIPGIGNEYVEVNIPDYSLTWYKDNDTLSYMKVCVGSRRELAYEEKIKAYNRTGKLDDKPKNHQTPILLSKFNSIQVNPIWNIPVSIAQNEIYYNAARDPYYLSNNNMRVYYKGKLVADPDTIQWSKYSRERLPFQFKQGSGSGNALGKFKFIFENGSSIYLHDTNNKSAFNRSVRAVSHGCVRVEKPLEFAENLLKSKAEYDQLRMEVNLPPLDTTKMKVYQKILQKKADTVNAFQLKPKWFGTRKGISIFLNYRTAWVQNGKMVYRNDVYGLDDALYNAMKKYR